MNTHTAKKRIDCHVHLVGNGRKGSGCWMRMSGWHKMMGEMMRRMISMPVGVSHEDFDEIYVQKLQNSLEQSSLTHALLLAQDEVYNENGNKLDFGSFHVPNDYLFAVCKKHPAFLPGISIHPARKDAHETLQECITQGAAALKLLPNCHNVNCSDPRYDSFWEIMAEHSLPLLAHTGGEMTVPVMNRAYQDPRVLRRPLEIGVKVIAAHCASASAWWDDDYFPILVKMMHEFPQLYADTSALNSPFRSAVFTQVLRSDYQERCIHGSDYPVPIGAAYSWLRGLIEWEDFQDASKIKNLLERDAFLKKAMGFSDEHFTQVENILRL